MKNMYQRLVHKGHSGAI